jgi:hypothetical protein
MLYVSEFSPEEYFIALDIEYESEGGVHKLMNIPIAIDISKFLVKEKPTTYSQNKPDFRSHQHFTLNNKSDLIFYNEGDMKIVRYSILN